MIYITNEHFEITKIENYCKYKAISERECVIMCNRRLTRNMVKGLFRPGAIVVSFAYTQYFLVLKEYDYSIVHHHGDVLVNSDDLLEVYMLASLIKRVKPEEYNYFSYGSIDRDLCGRLSSIIGKVGFDVTNVCYDIKKLRDKQNEMY